MDAAILPLTVYCRNAQLCLQKAGESQKSRLAAGELRHLKAFTTLVSTTIPSHPRFNDRKEEKHLLELQAHLREATQRMRELEECGDPNCDRPHPTTNGKHKNRQMKPVELSITGNMSSKNRPTTPQRAESSSKSSSSESMTKPQKSVRIAPVPAPKPPRVLTDRPQKWDINWSPPMKEIYGVVAKPGTPPRPISLIQKLKRASDASAADNKPSPHEPHTGKEVIRSHGFPTIGEIMPYRPKRRDSLRIRGAGGAAKIPPFLSKTNTLEIGPCEACPDECLTFEKSRTVIVPRGAHSMRGSELVKRGRLHVSEGLKEVTFLKSRSSSARKQKLASHGGGWVRGMLRGAAEDSDGAPDQEGSRGGSSHSNGMVAETNQDEDEDNWIEHRESQNLRASYGDESLSDRKQQSHEHEDRHRHIVRSEGLREWKGGIVRLHELHYDECENGGSNTARTSQYMNRRLDVSRNMDNRPTSAPRRMQRESAGDWKPKQAGEKWDEQVEASEKDPAGTLEPTHSILKGSQRGVKEDCERFRRQMRLLKEKANESRIREVEVEDMADRLQRRLVGEMDLAADDNRSKHGSSWASQENGEVRDVHRISRTSTLHGADSNVEKPSNSLSRTMTRLKRESHPEPHDPDSEMQATMLATGTRRPISSSITAIASNLGSSMSSLPFSHYIQKLKHLTPDSQLGTANLELLTPSTTAENGPNQHKSAVHESGAAHKFTPESVDTGRSSSPGSTYVEISTDKNAWRELSVSASSPEFSSTILLPATCSSSSRPPVPPPRYSNRLGATALYPCLAHPPPNLSTRTPQSDSSSIAVVANTEQDIDAILGGCALVASHLQDDGKYCSVATTRDHIYFPPPDNLRSRVVSNSIYENAHHEANDEKLANIQRVLGELKGSVEGVKIRIEVEGEGWRSRVEGVEKEIENLKEEADDEIIAAKHSIRNELKIKLGDFISDVEKMRREEREEVEMMLHERIEKQLQTQRDEGGCAEMKKEIRQLWAEVVALSNNRDEMQGHVDHLTSVAQKAQEHASREHDILKSENGFLRKQLQSLKNDVVQVQSETEDLQEEREKTRQALEKLKDVGTDTKLELQGLKKSEKAMKVELGNLQTGLEKGLAETEELERVKDTFQVEGGCERLLIMEKVEGLSQLYLGGLEQVRGDIFNVKFRCQERLDEFANQLSKMKRLHESLSEDSSTSISRQMLLDELDHFRSDMADMVEIERDLLRETLERESASTRRQVMDISANNQSDMLSILKLEVQKRLQSAHEKVLLMTDALKRDMDALKVELGHSVGGIGDLTQAVTMAERQRDMAAAAAADASMSATKASGILTEMLATFNNELENARLKLQENLATEKEKVATAACESQRVSHEILQERDTPSQAAPEATSSALKAGVVLAEILGSLNLEMAKARRMSVQLQEGLEKERVVLERERELAIQHSREARDRFSEELELSISDWKLAMNAEVAKAKEVTEVLEQESKRHALITLDQENLQLSMGFTAHHELEGCISKTEQALSSLTRTVKQLQDSRNTSQEEKKQHVTVKQQVSKQKELDWNSEISQLNQVVRGVEKRVHEACADHTEMRKILKTFEGTQMDLAHSVEEVRTNTCELTNTVNMWLPRYDAAARFVNDISCKVERMEEKFEGFGCDEGLVEQISRVAETKVQGLKELVISSSTLKGVESELRDLHEHVESNDRAHCQAISNVESRVGLLEQSSNSGGRPGSGLSLKLEYSDSVEDRKQGTGSPSKRTMDMVTESSGALVESAMDSRIIGLESRIEHVASATFTNLRLLDTKVERVSAGMQSAVEGAALAESKCGALGVELVKVFRMLTARKNLNSHSGVNTRQPSTNGGIQRGRSHSPPVQSLNPRHDSRSQSPPSRRSGVSNFSPLRSDSTGLFSPMRRSRNYISPSRMKGPTGKRSGVRGSHSGESEFAKGSEQRKVAARESDRIDVAYSETSERASEEGSSPVKGSWNHSRTSPRDVVKVCKLHGQTLAVVKERQQPGEHLLRDQHHLPVDKRQDGSGKPRQKTNIRLEAGRIHVNVSHRSAVGSQSEKRGDLIAVQS